MESINMKKVIFVSLLSMMFSGAIFAADGGTQAGREGGDFKNKSVDEVKAIILSKIDSRIKDLNEGRTCVQNATTKEDLKACRPKGHREGQGNGGQGQPNGPSEGK
jgi:hypothetical protein